VKQCGKYEKVEQDGENETVKEDGGMKLWNKWRK